MSSPSLPHTPLFRTTLFFGPEPLAESSGTVRCVFNVKKRSWKSGIQVDVRLCGREVDRAKAVMGYDSWVERALASTSPDERESYRTRAADLLAQKLCAVKLDLALEAGVPQENHVLDSEQYVREFDRTLPKSATEIKEWILTELDVEPL
jgi:hypothetical protein